MDSDNASIRMTSLPSWLLSQSATHAHRLVSRHLASVGARGYHFRTLNTLNDLGPTSQADLGRCAGIHLSDLVATLNQLAESGYVERSPDPTDRRRNVITITTDGRRRLRQLRERIDEVQDELLAPLTPQERTRLTTLLSRLVDHHGTAHAEPDSAA